MSSYDVFISYKREERPRVEVLAQKLKDVGLKVWFDSKLSSGVSFDEQIAEALKSAKTLLVCWTPGAISSEWVRGEAAMAHSSNKLVAVFLEPTELIPPFNLIHAENLADWSGEDDHAGWAKLLARLASLSDEAGLVEWAKLMADGDARALRAWVAAQPAGPLRSTTRFWISDMHAQPVFGRTGAPAPTKKQKSGTVVFGLLALVALVALGGFALWKAQTSAQQRQVVAQSDAQDQRAPSAARSAVVADAPAAAIQIADGTRLIVPVGSLVDLETGNTSTEDGAAFDFEIAFPTRYEIVSRGQTARIQWHASPTAPSSRQCNELPASEWVDRTFFPWRNAPAFQCFVTNGGHRGYIQHVSGYDDAGTGVEFTVTFFR